jgi:hypothetical protein
MDVVFTGINVTYAAAIVTKAEALIAGKTTA